MCWLKVDEYFKATRELSIIFVFSARSQAIPMINHGLMNHRLLQLQDGTNSIVEILVVESSLGIVGRTVINRSIIIDFRISNFSSMNYF